MSKRLYPRYSTLEVNPPKLNLEVQYNNECKKIYTDDAPPVKNALHHLSISTLANTNPQRQRVRERGIPMIILRTKREISQQYRHRRTRNNLPINPLLTALWEGVYHNKITNKQKPKHIIRLVKPNRIHNKIQLDENRSKG